VAIYRGAAEADYCGVLVQPQGKRRV
jgi:hypothetical protein